LLERRREASSPRSTKIALGALEQLRLDERRVWRLVGLAAEGDLAQVAAVAQDVEDGVGGEGLAGAGAVAALTQPVRERGGAFQSFAVAVEDLLHGTPRPTNLLQLITRRFLIVRSRSCRVSASRSQSRRFGAGARCGCRRTRRSRSNSYAVIATFRETGAEGKGSPSHSCGVVRIMEGSDPASAQKLCTSYSPRNCHGRVS
jgi:hypothetical protein